MVTASSLLISCATNNIDPSKYESGTFDSKVLIRDLKKNRSQVLNLEARATDPENIRIDITSSLGMHVFSLINRGQNIEYMVVSEKTHYQGRSNDQALSPVFSARLDPRLLGRIFFEKPFPEKTWTCTKTDQGRVKDCRSLRTKMLIEWQANKNGSRLISITQPGVSLVQINIRNFKNKADDPESWLKLKVPKSFKSIKI